MLIWACVKKGFGQKVKHKLSHHELGEPNTQSRPQLPYKWQAGAALLLQVSNTAVAGEACLIHGRRTGRGPNHCTIQKADQ